MSNFDRLNNYLTSFDAENERITSSINNQMLEKIISENQVQFNKDQEEGGGLIQGGQMLMNGQEQVVKFQKGLNTIKGKLDGVRDSFNQAKQDLDDLPNKLQNYRNQGNELLENFKERKSQLKDLIENKVKNTQMEQQGTRSVKFRLQANEDLSQIPSESRVMEPIETELPSGNFRIGSLQEKTEQPETPSVRFRAQANEDLSQIPSESRVMEPIEQSTENLDNELKTNLESQIKQPVESDLKSGVKIGNEVGELTTDAEESEVVLPELSEFVLPAIGLGLAVTGLTDLFSNTPEKVPDIKPPILKPPPNFQKMIQSQTTYSPSPEQQIQQSSAAF